ncbi:piezo non-specific cation channel, r-Ras-binding domain-containing protein [Ditylenchus destructor]|nr:piezo non-specific cation channel, r-Ras-binding domain-containing protein [Ditylenchus destructor]
MSKVNSTTTHPGNSTSTVCIIEQLLSIVCVNSMSKDNIKNYTYAKPKFASDQCLNVLNDPHVELETKIGFDMLAFIFIILQLRVLHSYFFQRCMIEFRCEMIQAKRGAILINQLIEKEMREQNNHQNKKVEEIKARTKSIRDRYMEQQQRASMGAFIPETYGQAKRQSGMSTYSGGRPGSIIDVDDPFPFYDIRYMPPENCMPAKRAGDYYMFDYDPAEADQLGKPLESSVPEVTPGAGDFDKLDPYQLLYTAVSKDLDFEKTLEAVEKAETVKDKEWRMIAAVAKSPQDRERVLKSLRAQPDRPEYREAAQILEQLAKAEKDEYGDDSDSPGTTVRFRKHKSGDSPAKSSDEGQKDPNIPESAARAWPELMFFIIKFVWKMLKACMESTAAFLNRRSREHRYVSYVLNKEKEKLKDVMNTELYDAQKSAHDLRKQWESFNMHLVSSHQDIRKLEEDAHSRFAAHTDIMCFFLAIWSHARCAGLITLPLPVLVFFWGSLAVPRPSKIFWIVMITYTELIICVKFIFQFSFWSWNYGSGQVQGTGNPYRFDYVLGIQQMKFFAVADVALLVSLFFHRYMLRKLGLWKDANVEDTFSPSPSTISTTANTEADHQNKSRPSIDTVRSDRNKKADTINDQVAINIENNGEENEAEPRPSTSAAPVESTQPSDNDESRAREKTDEEDDSKGSPIAVFFSKLLHPKFRYIRDLYPLMFFLDMFCFAIVAISYSSFGEGSGSGQIINDIQSSRVPTTFVLMLVIIACMIVIDRGLYLRKAVVCKLIYQLFSVIALHIWIFFVLPSITKKEAAINTAARNLYVVKCIYFFVSAWQIRNGYPSLCVGNLLTHSYGLANMVLFKVFMAVPFLFELRTSIDWTWTDTSMPLFDYFNMENFYATIYNLKCARTFEENFPAPKGEAKGKAVKYMMGLPMILILIMTVLLPLLLFGLLNQIGEPAIPEAASLSISIEGFPRALFRPESESFWQVSIETRRALYGQLLKSNETGQPMMYSVHLEFQRPRVEKKEPTRHTVDWSSPIGPELREDLMDLVSAVTFPRALPMYVIVPSEGGVQPAKNLLGVAREKDENDENLKINTTFNDLTLRLEDEDQFHWVVENMTRNPGIEKFTLDPQKTKYMRPKDKNGYYVDVIAFADRIFPSIIPAYLIQGGLVAMYAGFVLLIGKVIRGLVASGPLDVIINEIPNPDYLLKICLDIYLVREYGDFTLEQDLFAKLIFLFRSPNTLIRWTRYRLQPKHLEKGHDFEIKHSWDGKPIDHDPIKIKMRWHFERIPGKPHKRVVKVETRAPFFDDDPPNEYAGPTPGLWNYECVELFFANQKGHYLEIEVGPQGHWLCLLHSGYRQCFNDGKEIELQVENTLQGSEWICTMQIPLAYFPGRVTKFNAYALHGSDNERHFEALYAVTDGTVKEPDFHRLDFFGTLDSRRIIPEGYNRQPFNDMKYGDMWAEATKASES